MNAEWDTAGFTDRSTEPIEIREVHEFMVEFVEEWLVQWKKENRGSSSDWVFFARYAR